jgi:ATP-binding cassette subfamily C (CFTR/MRP) protein 1
VYNQTDDFAARLLFRVDRFSGSVYMFWALSRWLSIRLDFLCACLVFASSIFSVAFKGTLPASFSAIAITYTLRMGSFLQWTFRNLSLMEASAVAAERLFEYSTDIPVETQGGWTDIPSDWPAQGRIEVLDASLRYAPELPLSLRSLSINVTPGQRVGIVGRTGAGK